MVVLLHSWVLPGLADEATAEVWWAFSIPECFLALQMRLLQRYGGPSPLLTASWSCRCYCRGMVGLLHSWLIHGLADEATAEVWWSFSTPDCFLALQMRLLQRYGGPSPLLTDSWTCRWGYCSGMVVLLHSWLIHGLADEATAEVRWAFFTPDCFMVLKMRLLQRYGGPSSLLSASWSCRWGYCRGMVGLLHSWLLHGFADDVLHEPQRSQC